MTDIVEHYENSSKHHSCAGFVFAFYKQRKAKKELAVKKDLIQKQSEQLQSLDAAKSRFFANASHELRTPLSLMLGPISTILKDKQLTEKQANLLQLVQHSGKQLEQLVTDILDLGKLEMGKMELDEKPTEVAPFFRSYFAQFESLAASRQIVFSFDINVGNGVMANLDQAKCRQILNNLLSNAFKFTPTGERVEAKLSLNDGTLQLSVADTGPGIHPDDLPHLFDRYFQTTRPDKPAEGGTGIGLALCQQNAQLFGGKIEVKSTLGHGATFKVTFPVTLVDNVKALVAAPEHHYAERQLHSALTLTPPTTHDTAKPTILVVEDNPDLQAYIRLILSEKYQVVTAENGQAALGVMRYELGEMHEPSGIQKTHNSKLITPDLILSDLMMPVMDGFQLLEKLKSDDATRHIPVIMLTARADARDKLKALRIGVDDYLLKPFDEEELLARIENLLKNQSARLQEAVLENKPGATVPLISEPDREWLEGFEIYVRKHFSNNTLSVPGLAHEFAMSESSLLRQLKRLTGLSPIQYLQEMRLDEARRLLESRRYNSIAQLASKVGYEDARSFSRSFKQRFGKLPSDMMGE
jgi:DNA-binding response OmpR family regulator/nitrogen-specific signal transduction histidine kinase